MNSQDNIGLQLSGYVRGLLTIYTNLSWYEITVIGDSINTRFERAAWLSTDKGITFEKTFIPNNPLKDNDNE